MSATTETPSVTANDATPSAFRTFLTAHQLSESSVLAVLVADMLESLNDDEAYRSNILERASRTAPVNPTHDFIEEIAAKLETLTDATECLMHELEGGLLGRPQDRSHEQKTVSTLILLQMESSESLKAKVDRWIETN